MKRLLILVLFLLPFLSSCAYKHFADSPEAVAIPNIDVEQSLHVCEAIMHRRDSDGTSHPQVLGYWALRAQPIAPNHASDIARVYTDMIEAVALQKEFYLWHYTWAIADFYRLGSPAVQRELEQVYRDAVQRGIAMDKGKFVNGERLLLGFFHLGGWSAAKNFLVVPGNDKFNASDTAFFQENPQYQRQSRIQ